MKKNHAYFFLALPFLVFFACNKEPVPDNQLNPEPDNQLNLLLTEVGSGAPAPNVMIVLATIQPTYYPTYQFSYQINDTLGTTDELGQLNWEIPEGFPAQDMTLLTVANEDYWQDPISLMNFHPDSTLIGSVHRNGFVKVSINRLEVPPEPANQFRLVQRSEFNTANYTGVSDYGFAAPGETVDLIAKVRGFKTQKLLIEQYFTLMPGIYDLIELDSVFVPAMDTLLINITL